MVGGRGSLPYCTGSHSRQPPPPAAGPWASLFAICGIPSPGGGAIPVGGHNIRVSLGRIAWLVTVLACLVTAAILLLQGYYGYAGVTFAVALSAAINLT